MPDEIIRFNKGTIEDLIVDLSDRLENLNDLAGAGPIYDVRQKYSSVWIVQQNPAVAVGMSAYCLLDTTAGDYVAGEYELFLTFTELALAPRLGPIRFRLDD